MGVPGTQYIGEYTFGIEESGVNNRAFAETGPFVPFAPAEDQVYTIASKFDFVTSTITMWIDPDLQDTEANNPADLSLGVTFTNMNGRTRAAGVAPFSVCHYFWPATSLADPSVASTVAERNTIRPAPFQ